MATKLTAEMVSKMTGAELKAAAEAAKAAKDLESYALVTDQILARKDEEIADAKSGSFDPFWFVNGKTGCIEVRGSRKWDSKVNFYGPGWMLVRMADKFAEAAAFCQANEGKEVETLAREEQADGTWDWVKGKMVLDLTPPESEESKAARKERKGSGKGSVAGKDKKAAFKAMLAEMLAD